MNKAYKFRLYPNREQENQILRTFGCCRYVFNHYLALRKETYEQEGKTLGFFACCADLTALKQESDTAWLQEVDSNALQCSLRNLDAAYQNFFRRVKNGGAPGYPKFKSKHSHYQSYQTQGHINVFDKAVQLPKLGKVKCRISKQVQGRILSATVSQTPSGKYFVSLLCDLDIQPLPAAINSVGVVMGIRNLVTFSDGTEVANPKYLHKAQKALAKAQRKLARKEKGSANWEKQRIRVARIHEHIANQRADTLHKLSTKIIRENQTVCIKDLDVSKMLSNKYIAKWACDVGFYELKRMLEYKAQWHGRTVAEIPKEYPASQLCSVCGHHDKTLGAKTQWTCTECGTKHSRGVNAAINVLKEGLSLLA